MRLNKLNLIITMTTLWFVSLSACATEKASLKEAVKKPDLKGAIYCADEAKLLTSDSISFLDERNKIDRIVISKKLKKLFLLSQGRIYKSYDASFGFGFAGGNKVQSGDGRTPEGLYKVELKNEKSLYNKALRLSYPNDRDKKFAKALEVEPGGDIMIHGLPNQGTPEWQRWALEQIQPYYNWTQGCIAVADADINEIFSIVDVNTAIEICPRD